MVAAVLAAHPATGVGANADGLDLGGQVAAEAFAQRMAVHPHRRLAVLAEALARHPQSAPALAVIALRAGGARSIPEVMTLAVRASPTGAAAVTEAAVRSAPRMAPAIVVAACRTAPDRREHILAQALAAAPDLASSIRLAVASLGRSPA